MNSKSELKRLCTMNPLEMAERLFRAENELAKMSQEYVQKWANAERLIEWMDDSDRKEAIHAFTEGNERQIAYRFDTLRCKLAFKSGQVAGQEILIQDLESEITELRAEVRNKQARIDELMLEYCPHDITPEQMANWEAHQRPVSPERQAEIDKEV